MSYKVVNDYTPADGGSSNINVYIRARPLDETLNESTDFITIDPDSDGRKINISPPDPKAKKYGEVSFQFDKVFMGVNNQNEVFETVNRPQIDYILAGFNCCCFACKLF